MGVLAECWQTPYSEKLPLDGTMTGTRVDKSNQPIAGKRLYRVIHQGKHERGQGRHGDDRRASQSAEKALENTQNRDRTSIINVNCSLVSAVQDLRSISKVQHPSISMSIPHQLLACAKTEQSVWACCT